jgi:hypothetical protein
MELKGFREILLKKAEGNTTLQTLIAYAKDEVIIDKVLESLEKMARPNASMGRGANAAVVAFANQLKNKDVAMMHDALGHHVSHYKNALKAAQDPGTDPGKIAQHRKVADQHLNKIIPLMHLAGRAAPHSGGALALDYVPTEGWESNYTRLDRNPQSGKLQEGTKGLGRRPKSTKRNPFHQSDPQHAELSAKGHNPYGVPDYRYLEMPQHPGHPDYKSSQHEGGYPFEETLIGNPAKVDAKEAYLHDHDVQSSDKYTPHPFDSHPVHSLADVKQGSFLDENDPRLQKFAKDMEQWHESEPSKNWAQKVKEEYAKDPEAFKTRGKNKPTHAFEGINLAEPEHHVKHHTETYGKPEKTGTKKESSDEKAPAKGKGAGEISEDELAKLPPAVRAIYMKARGK